MSQSARVEREKICVFTWVDVLEQRSELSLGLITLELDF